jgi:hypothetical protein
MPGINDLNLPLLNNNNNNDEPYKIEPNRWYKSYPYGFAFWSSLAKPGDPATETFWLPISPRDINVTTHYATNVITTLYGIIEEHSEVRYYDIVIQGNTGIAPKYTVPFYKGPADGGPGSAGKVPGAGLPDPSAPGAPSQGRASFPPQGGISLGGFLPEVTNTINAAANLVKAIAGGPGANETGIKPEQSGYYAFHNFYKFLLRYKMDTAPAPTDGSVGASAAISNQIGAALSAVGAGVSGDLLSTKRKVYPLQFLNYKDNIKYDCIPISFTLTRSADNPMLYNYSIRLRAFNLQNVNAKGVKETDLLSQLGLGDLGGSLFSKMTSIAGNASTLLSGIKGLK